MSLNFQELDHAETPYGELILRKRRALSLGGEEFYEVKLDGDFLMSSLVNQSEIALAELGLAGQGLGVDGCDDGAGEGRELDVVVGGLGLGYTAAAALEQTGVASVTVIDSLSEVIAWHERGLVPLGAVLTGDARCRLVHADFFELARQETVGFDTTRPGRRFDAVLLDIDHSPGGLLHSSHADFYQPQGLQRLIAQLKPGGVFALWSFEPPEDAFTQRLGQEFGAVEAHAVTFYNPLLDRDDINAIYVCR